MYGIENRIVSLTHGGVAHLGERLNGIQEVVGSIPIVSTKNTQNQLILSVFILYAFKHIAYHPAYNSVFLKQ